MSEGDHFQFYFVKNVGMVGSQMLAVYINWFFLFPYFFQKKQYVKYALTSLLVVYVLFVFSFQAIDLSFNIAANFTSKIEAMSYFPLKFKYSFWGFLSGSSPYSLSLISSLALRIYQENNKNKDLANQLKIQQSKTEIQYLRSQINPHFLFNSLNNIHTLILLSPKKASEYTILLSDLLRYMLYEIKKEKTELKNERKGLEDYFSLVKMRMEDPNKITINFQLENPQLMIAPLLLVSLVENGIKHSGIEFEVNSWLKLEIEEKEKTLHLHLTNSVVPIRSERNGLGLENLKKRLELNYPDQHDFQFSLEKEIATTQLTLNLN